MIKKSLTFVFLILYSNLVFANEQINKPSINVLGKSITESFTLFPEKIKGAIDPVQVSYRVYKGKVNVIELIYPPEMKFETIRREINLLYKKYQQPDQGAKNKPFAIWHLPNKVEIQMQTVMGKFVEVVILTGESFDW